MTLFWGAETVQLCVRIPDSSKDCTAGAPLWKRKSTVKQSVADRKELLKQIKSLPLLKAHGKCVPLCIGAVRKRIEYLAAQDELDKLGDKICQQMYTAV